MAGFEEGTYSKHDDCPPAGFADMLSQAQRHFETEHEARFDASMHCISRLARHERELSLRFDFCLSYGSSDSCYVTVKNLLRGSSLLTKTFTGDTKKGANLFKVCCSP